MKRDMNLIRTIMQKIEACDDPSGLDEMPKIEEHSGEEISYHIKILCDAGLVDAKPIESYGQYRSFFSINLTWHGQDFLDAARDDTIWAKAMETVIKPGASLTFDMLLEWLKVKAKEKIGLP